jgi:hypothetical protein
MNSCIVTPGSKNPVVYTFIVKDKVADSSQILIIYNKNYMSSHDKRAIFIWNVSTNVCENE